MIYNENNVNYLYKTLILYLYSRNFHIYLVIMNYIIVYDHVFTYHSVFELPDDPLGKSNVDDDDERRLQQR